MNENIGKYGFGSDLNTANGLDPIVNEYEPVLFVKTMHEYLMSENDKHKYITVNKNKKFIQYCTTVAAFDIEVSSLKINGEKRVVPYIWQIAIQDYVFYGRHFEDIVQMFELLHRIFETNIDRRLIIWVHNLSYEFQFIRKYLEWSDKVFCLDERKPINALTENGIEFRCSYVLSGMSLADLANKGIHKDKVKKMVGDLDYDLIRHEKTPLSEQELQYCINDVLVCVEYITEQVNELYGGDITTLPMTKTGAVRDYVRKQTIFNEDKHIALHYKDIIEKLTVEEEEYKSALRAFTGGFTHANPNYIGEVIKGVSSADICSSYPAVICSEKFPMSKGVKIKLDDNYIEQIRDLSKTGLLVFDVGIVGLRSKYKFEHILQYSKCWHTKKCKVDNNRVAEADVILTTMTSIDFGVLLNFYDFDNVVFDNVWYYTADYLPVELVEAVLKLYSDKTKLKDVCQELLYALKKSNLNSVYGMMVMAILREVIDYVGIEYVVRLPELKEALDIYNNSKSRFLFYPWGIFVTAYARKRLQEFILRTGDDHVYSDTDSDKFINIEYHKKDIEWFNNMVDYKNKKAAEVLGLDLELYYPKDIKGVVHPLGHLEIETEKYGPYSRFKTLGAKRYLVEEVTPYGTNLKLTCAGVNKKKGVEYLTKQDDPFEFFDIGMWIPPEYSGKMTSTYIDDEHEFECVDYLGNKDTCRVKSGMHLEKSEFQLNMDYSYRRFLASIENEKYIVRR